MARSSGAHVVTLGGHQGRSVCTSSHDLQTQEVGERRFRWKRFVAIAPSTDEGACPEWRALWDLSMHSFRKLDRGTTPARCGPTSLQCVMAPSLCLHCRGTGVHA